MGRTLISRCEAVVTMDDAGTELTGASVLIQDGVIAWVGAGAPPGGSGGAYVIDGRGTVALPGLVSTHQHLYQVLTRACAPDAGPVERLAALYPIWSGLTEEHVLAAARAGLAELALSGCTTATDHHDLHPEDAGDCLAASIEAAAEVGVRLHAARGSMDLGRSRGGLPPDELVEPTEDALAATGAALDRWHDPEPGAMVRVAVAPSSPLSASEALMRGAAELARGRGDQGDHGDGSVRLHTHLDGTAEETERCLAMHACRPVEWLDRLGWLGDDAWLAGCVRLEPGERARLALAGVGVAHCPTSDLRLGSGLAPVPELLAEGVAVGLGAGAAGGAGDLLAEARQALLVARGRLGPAAMDARGALGLATRGGAAVLGREDLGRIEPGMRADLALFRVDTLPLAGSGGDPVAALVLCAPQRAWHVLVEGRTVVAAGQLATLDERAVADEAAGASADLLERKD